MHDFKPVSIPFLVGTKLSLHMCHNSNDDFEDISKVPYSSVIGILMHAMVCSRPNIFQEVGVLSRFMSNLGKEHWTFVRRVFRYLCRTLDYCLVYHGIDDLFKSLDI